MSTAAESAAPASRRRTWSRFAPKKMPTEYEFVSHDLHWHYKPGQPPWEIAPDHVWNTYYTEHRNDSPFQCGDWNQFRDPDGLVYRTYVRMQDAAETYVDGVIDDVEGQGGYADLDSEWVEALRQGYTPFRYVGHALMMASTYVMSMAPSSYISNAAAFQAGDELRRIQRVAYQARQLDRYHPHPDGVADRPKWEASAEWQPLRKVLELLLAERDWGKSFAQLNLVVKPAIDALYNEVLADAAAANGDDLTSMMHRNLQVDSERSRRWTGALCGTAISDTPTNAALLADWASEIVDTATDAVLEASSLLSTGRFPLADDRTRAAVCRSIESAVLEAGLKLDQS
jgi:toluene monooxygenase system protein E